MKYHQLRWWIFIQFSAIDPYTRILVSKIYPTANSKNAKDFLLKTIKQFPFKIKSIQVNGGSEFRRHFEEECKQQNIPLFVLPPYSPKYNGRVENKDKPMQADCEAGHLQSVACRLSEVSVAKRRTK